MAWISRRWFPRDAVSGGLRLLRSSLQPADPGCQRVLCTSETHPHSNFGDGDARSDPIFEFRGLDARRDKEKYLPIRWTVGARRRALTRKNNARQTVDAMRMVPCER